MHTSRYSAAFARHALAANSRPVINERRIRIYLHSPSSGLRQSVSVCGVWFSVVSVGVVSFVPAG